MGEKFHQVKSQDESKQVIDFYIFYLFFHSSFLSNNSFISVFFSQNDYTVLRGTPSSFPHCYISFHLFLILSNTSVIIDRQFNSQVIILYPSSTGCKPNTTGASLMFPQLPLTWDKACETLKAFLQFWVDQAMPWIKSWANTQMPRKTLKNTYCDRQKILDIHSSKNLDFWFYT